MTGPKSVSLTARIGLVTAASNSSRVLPVSAIAMCGPASWREQVLGERFLRRPAAVDGRLAHAGSGGDVLEAHGGEALLDQQLACRGEDGLVGALASWPTATRRGRVRLGRTRGGGRSVAMVSYNTKRIVSMLWRPRMTTKDNTRIVALIERAERETPFCDCGEPMAAMARRPPDLAQLHGPSASLRGHPAPAPRHARVRRAHAQAPRRPGVGQRGGSRCGPRPVERPPGSGQR